MFGITFVDTSSVYDWVVDIDLITNIGKEGWKVTLSQKFFSSHASLFDTKAAEIPNRSHHNEDFSFVQGSSKQDPRETAIKDSGWDGATVAVVGLYDKGKTFVLNNLTQSNLPSG